MPARKSSSKKKVAKKKAVTAKKKVVKKKAATAKKKVVKKKAATAKKKIVKKKTTTAKKKIAKKKTTTAKKKAVNKKAATAKKKAVKKKAVTAKKKAAKPKAVAAKKTIVKKKTTPKPATSRTRDDVIAGPIHGIAPYQPQPGEEYMSDAQLEHFRAILTAWKQELMHEVDRTLNHMQDEAANFPDPNDRASQESEFGLELRTRDRERKLLRKIDSALNRIEDGSYGYCDETGDEIGLKRLEARPVATLCIEAQERREHAQRQFRGRDHR